MANITEQEKAYQDQLFAQAKLLAEKVNTSIDTGAQPMIDEYGRQIESMPTQFNPYRNSADLQARLGAKTVGEQMANAGLTRSGTNVTQMTALETAKQGTLAGINKAETDAIQQIKTALSAYIGQRDAAKQSSEANIYGEAYQNVAGFKKDVALTGYAAELQKEQAKVNQQYQIDIEGIRNTYNIELARIGNEYTIAAENRDFARQKELDKQRLELDKQLAQENARLTAERDKQLHQYDLKIQANSNNAQKSGGGIDPNTGKKYPDAVLAAMNAVESGHNYSNSMSIGLGIYNDIASGRGTKAQAIKYIQENYGRGQMNREGLNYLLLAAGLNPNSVQITVTPTGRDNRNQ